MAKSKPEPDAVIADDAPVADVAEASTDERADRRSRRRAAIDAQRVAE